MSNKIPVVKVLIKNSEEKFLMLRNSDKYNDHYSEKWEQPGGKIKENESRFEAGKREIREETGLKIDKLEDLVRIEIEEEDNINCYVLFAEKFSGDIELSEEHKEYRWFSVDEFQNSDWHRDSGYIIPAMKYWDNYLSLETNY